MWRSAISNWRYAVLFALFFGPYIAFMIFGGFWLGEHGWLLWMALISIASGVLFGILAARWTSTQKQSLTPIDWDAPHTFAPRDREAWNLVQEEANRGETISADELTNIDVYIDTGRRLARRLAAHYHPLSQDPIEHVPVVELLTALELAAEDLNHVCRQVPGGDLVTLAHWKRAVQAAEYLTWANDIYTYLLPVFQPVSGLVRMGTQKLMVKPAWRNMQQNLLRWFFQAYVNRLGTHLVELYSGRLVIGADQYRKLTRRAARDLLKAEDGSPALVIAVAGARDSGKTRLIEALERARASGLEVVRSRLEASGFDEDLVDRLRTARWVEVPGYTATPGHESARDRATRRDAVEAAIEADLLLLVVDGSREDTVPDVRFAQAWDRWYVEHPGLEVPPALAIVTGADRPEWGGEWRPPHDWTRGRGTREAAVRARLEALRAALPPTISDVLAVGLGDNSSYGVLELVLPALASRLHRAERTSLIRYLHHTSSRSKARRLISQVGQQSRRLWNQLTSVRKPQEPVSP